MSQLSIVLLTVKINWQQKKKNGSEVKRDDKFVFCYCRLSDSCFNSASTCLLPLSAVGRSTWRNTLTTSTVPEGSRNPSWRRNRSLASHCPRFCLQEWSHSIAYRGHFSHPYQCIPPHPIHNLTICSQQTLTSNSRGPCSLPFHTLSTPFITQQSSMQKTWLRLQEAVRQRRTLLSRRCTAVLCIHMQLQQPRRLRGRTA